MKAILKVIRDKKNPQSKEVKCIHMLELKFWRMRIRLTSDISPYPSAYKKVIEEHLQRTEEK